MLLKIANVDYIDGANAVVSDRQMSEIIVLLQDCGVSIANPFVPNQSLDSDAKEPAQVS